jgi:hypothetical protein
LPAYNQILKRAKKIVFHFQTKQLWTIELSKREKKIGTENEERFEERKERKIGKEGKKTNFRNIQEEEPVVFCICNDSLYTCFLSTTKT